MKLNATLVAAFLATSAAAFNVAAQGQGAAPAQPVAQGAAGCDGTGPKGKMSGMMPADPGAMAAMAEKRLDRLKSELKLTPQQESLWQAYADKVKSHAGQGMQAMREKAQDQALSAPERMSQMMNAMKERMAAMQSANDAFKSFYDGLSAEQKAIADKQVAIMGRMGPRPGMEGMGGMGGISGMGGPGRPGRGAPQGGEPAPR